MKTIFPIRLILTFSFCLILVNTTILAQKIESEPILGAGRIVMYTNLEGLIGNKELRSNVRAAFTKYNYNILVYENSKRLLKKDIEIRYNNIKYVPNGYFIKEDKIVGYFIAGTKNAESVKLCLQEFDTDLKQIGQPVEVVELPRAIDPSKLLDNKSGGMLSDKLIKEQDLNVKYDKKSGTILFCFSLQLAIEQNLSYCKITLLNEKYELLNSFEYNAESAENYIKATPQNIYENGDALVSLSEGIKVTEKNSFNVTFNITKQAQIFVPANGNKIQELELIPDQSRIINNVAAEDFSKDGHILYSILSTKYDKEKNDVIGYINLYKYNSNSEKLERESYQYSIKDAFTSYSVTSTSSYRIKKIYNLSDQSTLFWLIASPLHDGYKVDCGNVFIKIDKDNQISWIKGFRKESVSLPQFAEALDFFDSSGNFNLIFNFHPKKINNDNTLKTYMVNIITRIGRIIEVDENSIPIIATLNISSGEITMKKMTLGNSTLGGVLISESEKLGENGKYRMHMMINKKMQFVDIDFNAN